MFVQRDRQFEALLTSDVDSENKSTFASWYPFDYHSRNAPACSVSSPVFYFASGRAPVEGSSRSWGRVSVELQCVMPITTRVVLPGSEETRLVTMLTCQIEI